MENLRLKVIDESRNNRIITWGIIYWIALTISFMWTLQIHSSSVYPLAFHPIKYCLATISVLTMLILLPRDDSIVDLCLVILLYMVIFPVAVVYACQDRETLYYFFIVICMVFVEIIVKNINPKIIRVYSDMTDFSRMIILLLFAVLVLSVITMFRERGVPNLNALDFSITYEIRSSYTLSSLASRLYQVTTKAIIPFLIAVFFLKKQYKKVGILLAVQFAFFLWLANKTTVFSIGVLVIGYFIAKVRNGSIVFTKILGLGMITISVLEGVNREITNELSRYIDLTYSLFVTRSLFLPAHLKYSYYDYFVLQNHSQEGLLGTFIAPILIRLGIHDPYENYSFTRIIGDKYYLVGSSANTGIFGLELAHFGYLGVLIAALLLLIFLICVKKSETKNGRVFTCCLTIYTVIGLVDAGAIQLIDFSPMFLVAVILCYFEIDEYNIETERKKRYRLSLAKTKIM